VTVVHRKTSFSDSVKYWIRPNIDNRVKSGEIKAYFSSRVRRIEPASVTLDTPDGEVAIPNDFVFAMTGYRPDTAFLNRHGIEFDQETQRPRLNAETLECERKGVYLAGVLVAGMHTNEVFIENGRFHGQRIAEAITRALSSKPE